MILDREYQLLPTITFAWFYRNHSLKIDFEPPSSIHYEISCTCVITYPDLSKFSIFFLSFSPILHELFESLFLPSKHFKNVNQKQNITFKNSTLRWKITLYPNKKSLFFEILNPFLILMLHCKETKEIV